MTIPTGPWVSNRQVIDAASKNALTIFGSSELAKDPDLNPFDEMDGAVTYIRINKWCIAQIIDVKLAETLNQKAVTDEGWIGFQFALSGDQISIVDGYGQMNFSGPRFNVCATGHATKVTKFYLTSSKITYVNIIVKPQFLIENFDADYQCLPHTIQSIIDGKEDAFFSGTQPLQAEMSFAAEALVNNKFEGKLKETYTKVKVTELLCLAVHAISQKNESRATKLRLNDREIKLLHQVRNEIHENYASPPPLIEISRKIGLNRNKLSMGFKELFGSGVYEYCQLFRMQKAKSLLQETRLSIIEIAIEVGFQNQSSFSRAYKDFYNHAPSQDRANNTSVICN